VSTLKELIDYAGKNPEKLTAGFPGSGTLGHITGVLFGQRAKVDIKHLQYRGGGPIIADLLGGHVDLAMDALTPYVAQVQDGKLRGLAVTTATRVKQLPDVPTVAEAGLPGFDASVWYCLLGPANLPPSVTAKLNEVANAFVKSAKTQDLFDKLAVIPVGSTPEELRAFIVKEIAIWEPVIKAAKIQF
jgi:tripartite-type tricarboxylate transporter receptor subunit TctC